jgi:hypothetical protein
VKTLEQHNLTQQVIIDYNRSIKYHAKVLCDKCGTELLYSDDMILASSPPKRNVHCPHCGTHGYKIL